MSAKSSQKQSGSKEPLNLQVFHLGRYEPGVRQRIEDLKKIRLSSRLWQKDPGLWKEDPKDRGVITHALGWLNVAEKMQDQVEDLRGFAAEAHQAGFLQVVHMGMGGSSLAPLVFQRIFPQPKDGLTLKVLDTTDPETILNLERSLPLGETLFIVASKSGTTAEPAAFGEYFFDRLKSLKAGRAGENFIAITDPGTVLEKQARDRGFRKIFPGFADIGGRYSALSPFGIVPAALMGLDVAGLLDRAGRMQRACGPKTAEEDNPGMILGAVLGELVAQGRDKLTFLIPEASGSLGLWLEQLLAESTGKEGTGILPVAEEPIARADSYGADRIFAKMEWRGESDRAIEELTAQLIRRGEPVIAIEMGDRLDLAQEFYRWEIATAVLGTILRINPFDQPNVQESKDNTNRLLNLFRQTGRLPEPPLTLKEGPLSFYGGKEEKNPKKFLRDFFAQRGNKDYLALQAYLTETPAVHKALQGLRRLAQSQLPMTTTLGYGPRFLHSTGQYHKGGPDNGLFVQLTAEDSGDISIPESPYSFGILKKAQALGDFEALKKHNRRIVGIHLGKDAAQGLKALYRLVEEALRKD